MPEAGILKINNLQQLQKELTQNFSNYNDSSSESCRTGPSAKLKNGLIVTYALTKLIVYPFSTFICAVIPSGVSMQSDAHGKVQINVRPF